MYLFDTSFVIDLFRNREGALNFAREVDGTGAFKAISIVTYHEMMRGLHHIGNKKKIAEG